jgi:hypothetical protein
MKKTILSLAMCLAIGQIKAQSQITEKNGLVGIGTTDPKAKLDVAGVIMGHDLISGGDNSWIFHTPDDGRKDLFIAPINPAKSDWDWSKLTQFKADGTLVPRRIGIGTDQLADGIGLQLENSALKISDYSPTIYLDRNTSIGGFTQGIQTRLADGTNNWFFGALHDSKFIVSKGGAVNEGYTNPKLVVQNNGFVGVGIVDPETKLQVGNYQEQTTVRVSGHIDANKAPVLSLFRLGVRESLIAQYGPKMIFANTTGLPNYNDATLAASANMTIDYNGHVGIGTIAPDEKLTVNGNIHAKEVRIDLLVPAPDYVFQKHYTGQSALKPTYQMPTLTEVEAYTKAHHHLPGVPSAQEQQDKGVQLGEMSNIMLQKIEELTLYMIAQQKEIALQKEKIAQLEAQNKK